MNPADAKALLGGLEVIEISDLESVSYACMLLGQLGAKVAKVEPPQGDPLRRRPPFAPAKDGGAAVSVAFEFLNAGKSSLVVDPDDAGSAESLRARLATADILVVDHAALAALKVELPARSAGQLRFFVGPYGGKPEDVVATSALTRLHAGTSGYIIPAYNEPERRPAWPGPYVFEAMHGVGLSVAIVAERSRKDGADVDYSLQAYGLWLDKLLFSRTSTSGVELHRTTAAYPYTGNIPCRDGAVAMLVLEEHQWRGFCRMIGQPDWIADERFSSGVRRNVNRKPLAEALLAWCAARTVDEVMEAARVNDVPAGRCRRPSEVLSSEVAADRGFFAERETAFGRVRAPTLPFGREWRGHASVPSPNIDLKDRP